ncbi:transposable element Tcb1 transposase [Trichonephila clavipes]|nr:transposable element Tcb1 transposase [Trichonephila clavipes]
MYNRNGESVTSILRSYHHKKDMKNLLHPSFGEDRVPSPHFPNARPPKSPYLNHCDYWLWGYLKSQVYRDRPTSFWMLRNNIRRQFLTVPVQCCSQHCSLDYSLIEAYEIHRGKGLEVRLSLALALSTIQVSVRFSSAKFPEETIDGDTTYLNLRNVGMELNGREIFFSTLHS